MVVDNGQVGFLSEVKKYGALFTPLALFQLLICKLSELGLNLWRNFNFRSFRRLWLILIFRLCRLAWLTLGLTYWLQLTEKIVGEQSRVRVIIVIGTAVGINFFGGVYWVSH